MRQSSIRLLAALHEMQHAIYSLEAGTISSTTAQRDVYKVARALPRLDHEWRAELMRRIADEENR